jgi:hypothetical protein
MVYFRGNNRDTEHVFTVVHVTALFVNAELYFISNASDWWHCDTSSAIFVSGNNNDGY